MDLVDKGLWVDLHDPITPHFSARKAGRSMATTLVARLQDAQRDKHGPVLTALLGEAIATIERLHADVDGLIGSEVQLQRQLRRLTEAVTSFLSAMPSPPFQTVLKLTDTLEDAKGHLDD